MESQKRMTEDKKELKWKEREQIQIVITEPSRAA